MFVYKKRIIIDKWVNIEYDDETVKTILKKVDYNIKSKVMKYIFLLRIGSVPAQGGDKYYTLTALATISAKATFICHLPDKGPFV